MHYLLLPVVAVALLIAGCQRNDAEPPQPAPEPVEPAPEIAPTPPPEPEAPPAYDPMPEVMHEDQTEAPALPEAEGEEADRGAELWDRARVLAEQAQERTEEALRIGREEGGEAWEAAKQTAARTRDQAQDAWEAARDYTGDAWTEAREAAKAAWSDASAAWERLTTPEAPEEE